MAVTESSWIENNKLIVTRISGQASSEDVSVWEKSFHDALDLIPAGGVFKIMVDLHGFKADNFEVHKQFRTIVPQTLAAYGWRVGYLDMFPEATITIQQTRGIQCVAAVHVHQDETKIKNYDENFSRFNERFFTDPMIARNWINDFIISTQVNS